MQICRAEDGQVFQINTTLYDIAKKPSTLRTLLAECTSVDPGSMIMFLSDGQQLREDNIRELSDAQDQTIFVFNRDYLDLEVDEVMSVLGVREGDGLLSSGSLQEDSISSLRTSQVLQDQFQRSQQHQSYISALFQQIHSQHDALLIASANLDMHILTLSDAWMALRESIGSNLETQAKLLDGIDYDLDTISQLSVHPSFLAVASAKSNTAPTTPIKEREGDGVIKAKTLGEYVSRVKMKLVVDSCRKMHADLKNRYRQAQTSMDDLIKGSDEIRASIHNNGSLSDASLCTKRSMDDVERMGSVVSAWSELEGEGTQDQADTFMAEVKAIDGNLRQGVVLIGEIKNRHTRQLLSILRQISTLQSSIFALPGALSSLESDLRVKGGFSHLQRLHGMAFAYGASVIEVVRRKEFERFFLQRAQAMAEIMAKFSSSEKKRRQVYRGESLSLLPFATQGMDLQAPSVEISTFGTEEGPYEMTREDIEALLETMRQIEREHEAVAVNKSSSYSQEVSYHPIRSTREALEKLLARMDGLEAEFDKIAEKSILSTTRLSYYKRRSLNEATAYNEATEQLHELQEQKATLEQKFSVERASLQNRIRELEVQNKNFNQQLPNLENTIDHLEVLLKQARNNLEQTHTRYEEARSKNETYEQDLSQRNSEISKLLDKLVEDEHAQQALKMERAAMADMTVAHNEQIERASRTATLHLERIAALERDAASLAEENRLLQQRDEENRRNIEDVERQLSHARDAEREAKVTLMDTVRERDRLLRDHQVEADGDRAVLEHRFSETRAQLDTARQQVQSLQQKLASVQPQLSSFQSQNSILHADLSSMREQLQRTSRELATSSLSENSAHQKENTLRAELSFANNALMQMEGKFERTERLLAQVFDVAIAFRNSHAKAMAQAQMMLRPIVPKNSLGISITGVNMADSTSTLLPIVGGTLEIGSPPRTPGLSGFHSGLPSANDRPPSPTPVDPSDPAAALDILREFDLDSFSETIAKTGVTIRKWQKQCREYRDRARSKITFRNFQKGDLALFLPTRNPSARPWAAFNMSFPHYFLNTTGHVSEQLKTREWIVARITSITERVVDSKDPSSNPYGLGNGVKYYLLDVEDWTANTPGSVLRPKASRNTSIPTRTGVGNVESWRDSTVLSQSPPQLGSLLSIQPKSNTDPDIAEGITAITSRPRATTGSSIGAGPSSLSRLLAQASKDASPVESKLAPETSSQKSPVDSPATPRALKPEPETKSVSGSPQLEPVTTQSTVEQPDPTTTTVPVPPNSIPSAHSAMPVHPPLSQRNSPKPSPRPRPVSLLVTGASPLASTSNVNAKASNIAASNSGVNRRHSSVRSSISSTRPTSIVRRPPFALSSSPSKAVVTASAVTAPIVSPSTDISSPFKTSSEDLNLSASITEDASETPSPADSVTEGMSSILSGHARRRTTSTITPATAALSHSAARGHQPSSPSPLSVTSLFSSLTGGWRKRRPDGASTATGHERSLSMSHPSPRDQRVAGSEGGAADILRRLDGRE